MAFVFWKKHKIPNLFWRIVIRVVCVVFIISVWLSLSRLQFGTLIWDTLFLAIVVPLFCFRKCDGKTKGYLNLFSRTPEGMQFRSRCLAMSGCIVLIHLAVFTFFVASLAKCTARAVKDAEVVWQAAHPPRFAIDPNDYSFLLSRFETENQWDFLSEWLPMVDPEDISSVLTALKERLEKTRNSQPFPGMLIGFDPNHWSDLAGATGYCGKDALPYILPFLNRTDEVLIAAKRGQAGDLAVRDQLVQLWRDRFDKLKPVDITETMGSGWLGNNSERAGWKDPNVYSLGDEIYQQVPLNALISVCPFSESKKYILEYSQYMLKYNQSPWLPHEMLEYLDRQQKGEILNALIPQLKEKPSLTDNEIELLKYNCQFDTESREWLWKQLIERGNEQRNLCYLDYFNLEQKPFDCDIPDELLVECLNNKNERLRAMGQHIWHKLGKPLDEQTLNRWAKDSDFMIRANAALLKPDEISADDSSKFVRLIRTLTVQHRVSADKKTEQPRSGGF